MTAAAPRAPSPPEDRPLAAEPPSPPRSPACSPPAMEGREDVECDCQEAFAEAQRWVEVRRLSFLWCVAPSSPAVPSSWGGRAGRHPCSPAPGRGLAAPPARRRRQDAAVGLPHRRAGAPGTRLPNFVSLSAAARCYF